MWTFCRHQFWFCLFSCLGPSRNPSVKKLCRLSYHNSLHKLCPVLTNYPPSHSHSLHILQQQQNHCCKESLFQGHSCIITQLQPKYPETNSPILQAWHKKPWNVSCTDVAYLASIPEPITWTMSGLPSSSLLSLTPLAPIKQKSWDWEASLLLGTHLGWLTGSYHSFRIENCNSINPSFNRKSSFPYRNHSTKFACLLDNIYFSSPPRLSLLSHHAWPYQACEGSGWPGPNRVSGPIYWGKEGRPAEGLWLQEICMGCWS